MNRTSMLIDAAVSGRGLALARTTLAAWDLITGRLAAPFSETLPVSKTYWIVAPRATSRLPKIETFRQWLLKEAAEDLSAVGELMRRHRGPERARA
jgi:LysR family glycine cleavage system transcriptional activator